MSRKFRYILRYLIDPGFEPEARIRELVVLCQKAEIAEVMLLLCAEELSPGHPTKDEMDPWIELAVRLREALRTEGIALSLNPWSTIYHNQRGRRLRPGQTFRLMVGENGVPSTVSVCPLCENWQDHLLTVFRRLIREVRPSALWVEDDWRLHNHDRAALGWGGCFCPYHLTRFSRIVEKEVGREELLAALLQPGSPHPWRQIWRTLCRETLELPLARLAHQLHQEDPALRLGLMTSAPDQHSLEGRDWSRLPALLEEKEALLIRPHLPPYTQENPFFAPPSVTRQTLACLQDPVESYPELENSPRCGPYSKSRRYTRWQMVQAALYGSRGITINHFDMMGNGLALDPEFGEGLQEAKPLLNALGDLNISESRSEGISVLFDPEIARHFPFSPGEHSLSAMAPHSVFWSQIFYTMGLAHRFCTDPVQAGALVAVSGQSLRGLSDSQIPDLLSRAVLLDATSAAILIERGFGEAIGLQDGTWQTLVQCAYAYERLTEPDPSVYGVAYPRLTAQRCATRLLAMTPREGALTLSTIHDASHRNLWPGAVEWTNSRGGRVVTLCYPLEPGSQFTMGFYNRFRRIFLQRLAFRLAPSARLAAVGHHPMHAYRLTTDSGTLLAACNVSDDEAGETVWVVPHGDLKSCPWRRLAPDGQWHSLVPTRQTLVHGDRLVFPLAVPPLGEALLLAHPL